MLLAPRASLLFMRTKEQGPKELACPRPAAAGLVFHAALSSGRHGEARERRLFVPVGEGGALVLLGRVWICTGNRPLAVPFRVLRCTRRERVNAHVNGHAEPSLSAFIYSIHIFESFPLPGAPFRAGR